MIKIKLFAILKDKAGVNEILLEETPRCVGDLLKKVSEQFPQLSELLTHRRILVSVNQEFAKPDTLLKDNDEVALLPPVSGG